MKKVITKDFMYIVTKESIIMLVLFLVFLILPLCVQAEEGNAENRGTASTFDELSEWMQMNMSTGGTITLQKDITVPSDSAFNYANGRYRKNITIETAGHTIYVEGYMELFPYLTIQGDGSAAELFHVKNGGELRLVSISIDAGENGTAIIQDDGGFLIYASEQGLPEFTCTGKIIESQKITAAAYVWYDLEKLPVVTIPVDVLFTADMLPQTVSAIVNRNHMDDEDEVSVMWDEGTFPKEQERTVINGTFGEEYAQFGDYEPRCLVVWESETAPYFLNAYIEEIRGNEMVHLYGETPLEGKVCILGSDDGETWTEITGTEGYEPVYAQAESSLSWMLLYTGSHENLASPRYYCMEQYLDDGTCVRSDILGMGEDNIFTASDIEGGRGGETSPQEGEDLLEEETPEPVDSDYMIENEAEDSTSYEIAEDVKKRKSGFSATQDQNSFLETTDSSDQYNAAKETGDSEKTAAISATEKDSDDEAEDNSEQDAGGRMQQAVGLLIVVIIVAGAVSISILYKKK